MEQPTNLNPEAIRKIGLRLYGSEAPATSIRDALVERLDDLVKTKGLETIAEAIGVSSQTIRSWLHGVRPTETNRKRIEQFLAGTSPPDAVGAKESTKSGERFGQAPQPPEPEP